MEQEPEKVEATPIAPLAVKKETDYWRLAARNFTQIAYLGIFVFIAAFIMLEKKIGPYQLLTPLLFVETGLFVTVWFCLGRMFKKHHVSAVLFGNVFMVLFSLNAIYNRNIIGLIIAAYFFWLIQKAAKTPQYSTQ